MSLSWGLSPQTCCFSKGIPKSEPKLVVLCICLLQGWLRMIMLLPVAEQTSSSGLSSSASRELFPVMLLRLEWKGCCGWKASKGRSECSCQS